MTVKGPPNGNSRRNRNSVVNNASKTIPVVGPGSAVGYGQELGSLANTLYQRLAQAKLQGGQIRGQYKMDRAAVAAQRVQGAVGAEANALQRNMVGSSADLSGRAAVVADAQSGIQQAIMAKTQGLLGLRGERISAQNEYLSGVFDVQARKRAEQAQMAAEAFQNDLVMRQGDEQSKRMDEFLAGIKNMIKPNTKPTEIANLWNGWLGQSPPERLDWLHSREAAGRM